MNAYFASVSLFSTSKRFLTIFKIDISAFLKILFIHIAMKNCQHILHYLIYKLLNFCISFFVATTCLKLLYSFSSTSVWLMTCAFFCFCIWLSDENNNLLHFLICKIFRHASFVSLINLYNKNNTTHILIPFFFTIRKL